MKRLLRTLVAFIALLLVLLAASPGLLYFAGLADIHGRPEPGVFPPLSVEQQNWLRCELRAADNDKPAVNNPWRLVWGILQDDPAPHYGDRVAALVARNYAVDNRNQKDGLSWQLSWASLTIWVARHWTLEQMESGAHEALHKAHRYQCEPGPAEWPQSPPAQP